jgi:hypothetical protein
VRLAVLDAIKGDLRRRQHAGAKIPQGEEVVVGRLNAKGQSRLGARSLAGAFIEFGRRGKVALAQLAGSLELASRDVEPRRSSYRAFAASRSISQSMAIDGTAGRRH